MNLQEHYRGKKTLITGGLGFIGSNLAIELVKLGARVTLIDSLIPEHGGNWFNIEPVKERITVNISDLRDSNSTNILVRDQDYIFHLAGQVSHGDSMRDPLLDLGVNCIATMNLVEACRHHNPSAKLVYTSTRQVYGIPNELPVNESHSTIPVDVNGINKLAGEYYHLLYHRTYGVRSTVLRLTNTYGPRQQVRNNRQGFIGIMIRQAINGNLISIYGTGQQKRDFNYVDDVTDAILRSATVDGCFGRVWNLGAKRVYSILEFVRILGELCDLKYEIIPFPDDRKIIDIGDYYGDYSSFNHATNWEPRIDLREGLALTLDSYRNNREAYL